ncbi:dipeptide ABC transporter ATP-binding protein [Synechococcus elongatus]|uniref:ABC transporter ATP-binding protein n=1 Tax=Synechococcus elongatus PCC 11802 TaxID=2283154 RepID=A0AAU6R503_SYNEL|nr:ABC transporter ATP-binding protein [Synechococcus elongatus]QFZ93009.1 ABC transporter ATP-binding protein [Synechococcus elongatus PCC 11802]
MTAPLLAIDQLSVTYPGADHPALQQLSLELSAGERLGLVGESGCGKSTLGRAILRLLPPGSFQQGDIRLSGQSIRQFQGRSLQQFRGGQVGLVFQDPMTRLDPLQTIGDHLLETLQVHRPQLSRRQAKQQALSWLERVRIPANRWSQYPHQFSGGMRQRLAIALALLLQPRLVIADEPTTSLDVTVAAEILQELTRLCSEENTSLLLISHDLPMVAAYCDRIAVLYQGQLVETGETTTVLTRPQHPYTQTLLQSARTAIASAPSTVPSTAPLLQLENVTQHFRVAQSWLQSWRGGGEIVRAVDGLSLEVWPGETLGLIGESGCGKSTLLRTILQLLRPSQGKVLFQGQDLTQLSDRRLRSLRREIQLIFQDPAACLNPRLRIGEAIADPLKIQGLAKGTAARQQVLAILEQVGLTPAADWVDRYPHQLSGGQQQRVAIARALITRPKLVLCDEPVSMLDATVQAQVLALMQDLKQQLNLTYLFVTHDLRVAREFCDRVAVLERGRIVEIGPAAQVLSGPEHPYTRSLLASLPELPVAI